MDDGKLIRFYGSSDDLIEVEGDVAGCDEYNAEDATFEVAGLRVRVKFEGCWFIHVGQIDEDVIVAADAIELDVHDGGYSMELSMLVPPHSHVTRAVTADA